MKKLVRSSLATLFAVSALAVFGPSASAGPGGLCSISGTVKLDRSDHVNGAHHFKGKVSFKANQALTSANLFFNGPKYDCTCLDCPRGSSHATGFNPKGKFSAGEEKTYAIDCPTDNLNNGKTGKGKIEHFIASNPPAGIFEWSTCKGEIEFKE